MRLRYDYVVFGIMAVIWIHFLVRSLPINIIEEDTQNRNNIQNDKEVKHNKEAVLRDIHPSDISDTEKQEKANIKYADKFDSTSDMILEGAGQTPSWNYESRSSFGCHTTQHAGLSFACHPPIPVVTPNMTLPQARDTFYR